jgi:hypothetical protein
MLILGGMILLGVNAYKHFCPLICILKMLIEMELSILDPYILAQYIISA